jgi:hypothetical protein
MMNIRFDGSKLAFSLLHPTGGALTKRAAMPMTIELINEKEDL